MYIKKGKPYFGKKDTWGMDHVLAPIITAGLIKFRDGWCKSNNAGLNGALTQWCIEQGMVSYINDYDYSEADWDKMEQVYLYMLDEMIYAFSSEEPEYSKHSSVDFETHINNYKVYNKRCDIGRSYFAEYFHSLWI